MRLALSLLVVLVLGSCLAYGRYSSPQDWPPFSFDPPQGWGISQDGPNKYDPRRSILFLGPANEANTLTAIMGVTLYRPDEPGAPFRTPEEFVAHIEGTVDEADERIRRKGTISVDGRMVLEIIRDAYYAPPKHSPPRREDRVADTNWFVVMMEGDVIFQIGYRAAREDFDKYAPLFERMLKTFRFQR